MVANDHKLSYLLKSNQGVVRKAHVFSCCATRQLLPGRHQKKAQVISFRPGTSLEALAATSMPLRRWSHGSKGDNSALRLVGSVTVKAGGIWCDTRASGTPSKWIEAGSSTRWT